MINRNTNNFKNTYGWDKLSSFILILGLIFLCNRFTLAGGIVLIIYSIWRSFSKNKYKRSLELQAFNNFMFSISQKFYRLNVRIRELSQYKIFKCPKCSQKLRVPRKKGNITITCKKCGYEFKGRS